MSASATTSYTGKGDLEAQTAPKQDDTMEDLLDILHSTSRWVSTCLPQRGLQPATLAIEGINNGWI
jgi:hypothetical protein